MIVIEHDVNGRMASNDGATFRCTIRLESICTSEEYRRLLSMLVDGKLILKEAVE